MSESGTMARVETVADSLARVLDKLDRLDERVNDVRVEVVALRGAVENVRALIDGVHARADKLEDRMRQLETDFAEHRGAPHGQRTVASVGLAAGGGGVVAGAIELVRALLGAG